MICLFDLYPMTDTQAEQHLLDKSKLLCIKKIVANHYKFDMGVYDSRSRKRDVVITKQVTSYFCSKYTKLSQTYIGESIGGYDHASVSYNVKIINNLMASNPDFKEEIEKLDNVIFLSIGSFIKSATYTINLNNISSIKTGENKAIIFVGYNTGEIEGFINNNGIEGEIRKHTDTGLYLVD